MRGDRFEQKDKIPPTEENDTVFGSEETGCKINLHLRVTGCRPDGYHTLATCFLPLAAPSDRITVEDFRLNGKPLSEPEK